MKRVYGLFFAFMSLFLIFPGLVWGHQDSISREMIAVTQKFFRGVYLGNLKDLQQSTLEVPDRESLIRDRSLSAEEIAELKKDIADLRLMGNAELSYHGKSLDLGEKIIPIGAKALLMIDFRGHPMMVNVVKQAKSWKVDPRFAIANKKPLQEGSPEWVAKRFLYAFFQKDRKTLQQLLTDPSKIEALIKDNNYPGGDLDQLLSLSMEMPVIRALPGESFLMPAGQIKKAEASTDEIIVVGLYGSEELAFVLKNKDGKWKIVPEFYMQMMRGKGAI